MKQPIYIYVQSARKDAYWQSVILDGIHAFAKQKRMQSQLVNPTEISPEAVLILVGSEEKWLLSQANICKSYGVAALPVNAYIPPALQEQPYASFALEKSTRDCLRYLASMGCKYPLLVGLNMHSGADYLKERIFYEEAARLGMQVSAYKQWREPVFTEVEHVVSELAAGSIKADSILCANDTAAIMTIPRLQRIGISVGKEFPVIGMGNSYLGRHMTPALTTVEFDYYTLGIEAARLYYLMTNSPGSGHESRAVHSISLPNRLIIRESTGMVPITNMEHIVPAEEAPDYFGEEETACIIRLENYLQHCSAQERELIFGAGESYSSLAEKLYISERTAKYRMAEILRDLQLPNKGALERYIQRILQL